MSKHDISDCSGVGSAANSAAVLQHRASDYVYDGFASYATDPDGPLVRVVEGLIEGFYRRPYLEREYASPVKQFVSRILLSPLAVASKPFCVGENAIDFTILLCTFFL
jgi:hypothetical protein